jgi:hypothetical protein
VQTVAGDVAAHKPVKRAQGSRPASRGETSSPAPAPADLAALTDAISKLAERPVVVEAPAVEQRPTRKIVKRDPETDLILETIEVPVTDEEWAALKEGGEDA